MQCHLIQAKLWLSNVSELLCNAVSSNNAVYFSRFLWTGMLDFFPTETYDILLYPTVSVLAGSSEELLCGNNFYTGVGTYIKNQTNFGWKSIHRSKFMSEGGK